MNEPRRRGFWFFVSLAIVAFSVPVALIAGFALAAAVDSTPVVLDFPSTISVASIETQPAFVTQTFVMSGDDGAPWLWAAVFLLALGLGVVALVQIARRR